MLHHWDGVPTYGGLDEWMIGKLRDFLCQAGLTSGGKTFLETGAGLSTLLFLCCNPKAVISCTLEDPPFLERLNASIARMGLSQNVLNMHVGRSELLLPKLILDQAPFVDFALIDGGHGWPTVFVDFCYINYATRQYGYIAIDDTQLYSVSQLTSFLKEQPGWRVTLDLNKVIIFQKLYDDRLLKDFGAQPFILMNSPTSGHKT